jgi:imidazolonepropionase
MVEEVILGPFKQLLTMEGMRSCGPLSDHELPIIQNAGIHIHQGYIQHVGPFDALRKKTIPIQEIEYSAVGLPGLIDAHTHLCWAGSRANEYALRLSGASYQSIAEKGGGILNTVRMTRQASLEELVSLMEKRCGSLLNQGVTTCEVKSGYGLTLEDELKILHAIQVTREKQKIDLIPTCLAAHTKPPEFDTNSLYLEYIATHLLPIVRAKKLANRIDIFVDKEAFSLKEARNYLQKAKEIGFQLTAHADQFSRGGSSLAAELGAVSADHLEASTAEDWEQLKNAKVIPVVLPGASLGLGIPYAPARRMLDQGLPVAIASDWNPGSAPMGYLLLQAAIMGATEKLTMAETFAAITFRAAKALRLEDRGILKPGFRADCVIYPCDDYREILYAQGALLPKMTLTAKQWKMDA